MVLNEAILQNEELVAALSAALAAGDDEAGAELIAARQAALATLADALAAAGPAGREACRGRLESLVAADRDLRAVAGTALARAGEAFRAQVGSAGRPPAADNQPQTACLDRRA